MKVMIVVTHLLGSGHLSRALVLARAINASGHEAHVVSGGFPVPHLDLGDVTLHQLPPLRADGVQFTRLLGPEDAQASDDYLSQRQRTLCAFFDTIAPDVLVTELFPFGRRVLREEFLGLLDRAQTLCPRPQIVSSIRDILAPPSKPSKAVTTEGWVNQYYDAVLVHSDPAITPLSTSWPVTEALAARLRYTGFVAPPAAGPHPDALGQGQVLVSAGGGDVGRVLFDAVLATARLDKALKWRVLVGGKDGSVAHLKQNAPKNAVVEAARPEFRQMLYHAKTSVSMCGYNTALDILQAGAPAVFVPFDDGGEIEQSLRANALANLPGIEVVSAKDLSPENILAAIARANAAPRRTPTLSGFKGAAETVRILEELLEMADHDR